MRRRRRKPTYAELAAGTTERTKTARCAHRKCRKRFVYPAWKKGAKYCSFPCAQAGRAIASAKIRGDKQRGRGEGKTYIKRGGQHEHRTVAEEMLGRKLRRGEVVHHEDLNKRNNDPGNLKVYKNQAAHMNAHREQLHRARGIVGRRQKGGGTGG